MTKAVVIHQPGPPEVLKLEDREIPVPRDGEVLIRVRAFGLNRSEFFTRRGLSPRGGLSTHPGHRGDGSG